VTSGSRAALANARAGWGSRSFAPWRAHRVGATRPWISKCSCATCFSDGHFASPTAAVVATTLDAGSVTGSAAHDDSNARYRPVQSVAVGGSGTVMTFEVDEVLLWMRMGG